MRTPVLNNHLKRQFILLGNNEDLQRVVSDLNTQGETVRYCCCIDQNNEKYLSIEQCLDICLSDSSVVVWTVSDDCDYWIEKLRSNGVEVSRYSDMFIDVKNRACHFEEMYIDRYGELHCCCKTYLGNTIGNLSDPDIYEKVINYTPKNDCVCSKGRLSSNVNLLIPAKPELASIELSSQCNAQCTYCFQNDEHKGSKYQYYDELLKLIQDLQLEKLIFAGGEILVQPNSIEFLRRLKRIKPDVWMHLKSNGNHDIEYIKIVTELFDSITVTLNGFGDSTVATIMKIPFDKTRLFCEKLCEEDELMVGIKFLASPANICEVPEFIEWAISLQPNRIIIPSARVYQCNKNAPNEWLGSSFNGLNGAYWNPIFKRVSERIKRILSKNAESKSILQIDNELKSVLGIVDMIEEFNHGC